MRSHTQADQVEAALANLGGYATLAQLYDAVDWRSWGTRTPRATIRRILQKDPRRRFFRIRPGLWGLAKQKEEILQRLSIGADAPEEQLRAFDHTYYQGLAVEIGNLRRFETFVPKSDRGKPFSGKSLSDLVTLDDIPRFTYDDIVERARYVDVIWFRKRKEQFMFPDTFIEVEHTTDFTNSLVKFVEFQDFRARFFVIADSGRRGEFLKRLSASAFDSIREGVRFVDYETLARLYERELLAREADL
ncbi:MAG: hypothetical protein NZ556_02525 [Fimbriimonadales bacterium]|nr:hypothetical protein [Fimbriimonadales bacterium]